MTIYDFVNSITDTANIVFTVFDCTKEDLISMDDHEEIYVMSADDLLDLIYSDYEIGGTDMWVESDGRIHIEFNIETEEDEYDEEDDDE